jgi:hypothetical protein
MKSVFDIVHQAQTAALKAARTGVPLESIDAAGRKVVVDNGYGPGFKYFTHRLGHGMGMDGHEWPYLVKNNMFGWDRALKMQAGMVFSDEPGIYIKGEFGVRLEDDMYVTENGAELFTPQSPSIEEPFDVRVDVLRAAQLERRCRLYHADYRKGFAVVGEPRFVPSRCSPWAIERHAGPVDPSRIFGSRLAQRSQRLRGSASPVRDARNRDGRRWLAPWPHRSRGRVTPVRGRVRGQRRTRCDVLTSHRSLRGWD